MSLSLPSLSGQRLALFRRTAAILRSYGGGAHLYLPGVGMVNGLVAGNYLDSAGVTPARLNDPVGMVKDLFGTTDCVQTTTANKPLVTRRVNLLAPYSSGFANWVGNSGATVKLNVGTAPDGTSTAAKLVASAVANQQSVYAVGTPMLQMTRSVYAKAGELPRMSITTWNGVTYFANVLFDLVAGVVVSGTGGSIEAEGNGWYRCSVNAPSAVPIGHMQIRPARATDTTGVTSGPFTPGDGIYLWHPQLEAGTVATRYQRVGFGTDYDTAGFPYSWTFDATDSLGMTFPAGYEAATIIDSGLGGQVTLSAQNIVGAYSIGPSLITCGRIILKTAPTALDLAVLQQFANRLAAGL